MNPNMGFVVERMTIFDSELIVAFGFGLIYAGGVKYIRVVEHLFQR